MSMSEFEIICTIINQCVDNNICLVSYTNKNEYETRKIVNLFEDIMTMIAIAKKYINTMNKTTYNSSDDVDRIVGIVLLCNKNEIFTLNDFINFASQQSELNVYYKFVALNDLIYFYARSYSLEKCSLDHFYISSIFYHKTLGLCKNLHALKNENKSNEYTMFKYMKKRHNAFSLYKNNDKEIMMMHWDRKLISFYNYACQCKNYDFYVIGNLLNVMNIMRKYNFYHGDLKSNNILVNPIINEIQIIDFQYSKILNDKTRVDSWDACINYFDYTNDDFDQYEIYFSKRIFYLYDVYKLVVSINYNPFVVSHTFKYSKNEIYLDFMVMCKLHNGTVKMTTTIFDMKKMLNLPIINQHHEKIRDIVNKEVLRNKPDDPV